MNMEPLREFVSLETRKKELDAQLKAAKQRLDELEDVIIPQFIEEGVPSMTVEVDGAAVGSSPRHVPGGTRHAPVAHHAAVDEAVAADRQHPGGRGLPCGA